MNKLKLLKAALFVTEGKARDSLRYYFQELYPMIEIVGMYDSCDGGTEILKRLKPDIVIFEQRKMQDGSGELYYALNIHQGVHSEMADVRELFEFNGTSDTVNIIHDPIDKENFKTVMDANILRYFIKNPAGAAFYYHHAKMVCQPAMQTFNEFTFEHGYTDIMLGNISFLDCDKQRTNIYLIKDNEIISTNQSMSRLLKHLPPDMFVAIGRSTMINGLELLDYNLDDKGTVYLKNHPLPLKANGDYNDSLFAWIEMYRQDMLED